MPCLALAFFAVRCTRNIMHDQTWDEHNMLTSLHVTAQNNWNNCYYIYLNSSTTVWQLNYICYLAVFVIRTWSTQCYEVVDLCCHAHEKQSSICPVCQSDSPKLWPIISINMQHDCHQSSKEVIRTGCQQNVSLWQSRSCICALTKNPKLPHVNLAKKKLDLISVEVRKLILRAY